MTSMRQLDPDHYLNSASFLRQQQLTRRLRKLRIDIEGIEPRSKKAMSDTDKTRIIS